MKQVTPAVSPLTGRRRIMQKIWRQRWLYLMLLPAFACLILFSYAPLSGWYIAFSEYKIGKPLFGGEWVGLKHFQEIFQTNASLGALLENTLAMNVGSLLLNISVPMVLAILLCELRWKTGAKIVQTVAFFPHFISWVIVYSLFCALFAQNNGVINRFLVEHGVLEKGINLLGDPKYSWGLMIGLSLWKSCGYNMIIYLSSISGISTELYDAAALDGANRLQQIRYITIPNLLPTASVLLIMNAGWILGSNLETYMVFQTPTNLAKMDVLDMYIYKYGLDLMDFPYATAMTIVKTAVGVLIMLFVNWLAKKLNQNTII